MSLPCEMIFAPTSCVCEKFRKRMFCLCCATMMLRHLFPNIVSRPKDLMSNMQRWISITCLLPAACKSQKLRSIFFRSFRNRQVHPIYRTEHPSVTQNRIRLKYSNTRENIIRNRSATIDEKKVPTM